MTQTNLDAKKPTEDEKVKLVEIDKKIIDFLVLQLRYVENDRIIDWQKFHDYCVEFGVIDPPNILTIPIPILERCINEAKEIYLSG